MRTIIFFDSNLITIRLGRSGFMLQMHVYDAEVHTTLPKIRKFISDMYYIYYKKPRCEDKNRHPELKVTDDIVSVKYWVKNREGVEERVFMDGSVFLNQVTIHTITLEGEKFDSVFIKRFVDSFQKFMKGTNGLIYSEINRIPVRIREDGVDTYNDLIYEIFDDLPEEKKEKHQLNIDRLLNDDYGVRLDHVR